MKLLSSLTLALCITFKLSAQDCSNKIGVNLDGIGGPALEFPDVVKTAWKLKKYPTTSQDAVTDDNGWPLEDFQITFFDFRPTFAWAPPADDPALYVVDLSGTYSLSFNGQADLSSWSDAPITYNGKSYDAATNTTTVNINWPSTVSAGGWKYGYFVLNFTNTKATSGASVNSGVKNIKLFRPGYTAGTNPVFRKEFLNAISIFSTLRFMDWTHTNNSGPSSWSSTNFTTWSDRQQPNIYPYLKGAPWEEVIALANMTGKDIWINIPVAANDDYIMQLATLMKNTLREDVNIYLEYSNEVWNGGFTQFDYNYSAVLNAPEDADIRASTSFDDRRRARRVAKRVIRIGEIFEDVLGVTVASRSRIRPVFAWQIGGWLPWYEDVLSWINATYGAPKNFIYGIASAPYFNDSGFGASETPQQIVSRMSANSDANVTAIKTVAQYAATWNLRHLQYEGGPDNGGGNTSNLANRIQANRIPEMKTAVIHNYQDNWFSPSANGTAPQGTNDLVNYFVLSGKVSRYGCWGATEDLSYLNDLSKAPKYDALCVLTGKCSNAPAISITTPSANAVLNKGAGYQIQVNASAAASITSVEYFAGSTMIGSSSSSPYSISWQPPAEGKFSIYAKVLDAECRYGFASPVNVTVSGAPTSVVKILTGDQILFYPNPTGGELFSAQQFKSGSTVEVKSLNGISVRSFLLTSTRLYLDLSGLPSGTYFIEATSEEGTRTISRISLIK